MKKLHLVLVLMLAVLWPAALGQSQANALRMNFVNADASVVFKAIAARTRTTIVYSARERVPVTINLAARDAEQAIRLVAATAGLTYRRVDRTFVVAMPNGMRQALEPFSKTVTFALEPGQAARFAPAVQEAFPHATVRAVGDRLSFTALPEDQREVEEVLKTLARREEETRATADVVSLEHASASEVAKLVTAMYPDVKVSSTPGRTESGREIGGMVGLVGVESQVTAAKKLLTDLDVPPSATDPVDPVITHVYTLRYTSSLAVQNFLKEAVAGVQVFLAPESFSPRRARFEPLAGMMQGTASGTIPLDGSALAARQQVEAEDPRRGERAKSVVLRGPTSQVNAALRLLGELDVRPKQVVVEVAVFETSPTNTENIGLNFNWSPIDFHEVPSQTLLETNPAGGATAENVITRRAGLGQWSRTPLNFRTILNAMVTKREAKILARPSVQVIDNDEASIFIGDTIRARVVSSAALGAQTIQIAEFPVGIILLISPRTNADGDITLNVNPIVSTVTGIDENNIPQTSAREAQTTVIVRDGETIVLGGLIRDEESKVVSEVPFLSRLPVVGQLFRNRSTSRRKTEIVVSITPRILPDRPAGSER